MIALRGLLGVYLQAKRHLKSVKIFFEINFFLKSNFIKEMYNQHIHVPIMKTINDMGIAVIKNRIKANLHTIDLELSLKLFFSTVISLSVYFSILSVKNKVSF